MMEDTTEAGPEMTNEERKYLLQRLREAQEEIGLLKVTRDALVSAFCFCEREWFKDFPPGHMRRLDSAIASAQLRYPSPTTYYWRPRLDVPGKTDEPDDEGSAPEVKPADV
jgi:hypothetical protein